MKLTSRALYLSSIVVLAACGPENNGFVDANGGHDTVPNDIATDSNGMDSSVEDAPIENDAPIGDDTPIAVDVPRDVPPLPPAVDIVATGAPADAPTRFGGSDDPSRAPTLVYPSDGTIVPHNLRGLEVHFRGGSGTDLYEVSFRGVSSVIRVYTPCNTMGSGCVLTLDDTAFDTVARAAESDGQVTLMVRGTSTAGGSVGSSSTRTLGITGTDIRGGVYFWAASAASIKRYEWGLPGAHAESFVTGGIFDCAGCHALSRDGTRMSVGRGIPGPAQMEFLDVTTNTRLGAGTTTGANFGSFSPDNSRFIASDGARLSLIDPMTATAVPSYQGFAPGSMPDWSPDGTRVVYALPSMSAPFGGSPGHSGAANLNILDWSGTGFGAPRTLLGSTGEDNYYPSFSPDNAWVIFNRVAGDSYNNIAAQMFAIPSAGGGAPVHLASADDTGMLGNSWPKWAPFVDTYQGEPIYWFTFTSRRDYGVRLEQQSTAADSRTSQLWMAAFRPNRASTDPSAPAFWLPFQNLSEGNHIAQWTQVVRRRSCTVDSDCGPNETCVAIAAAGRCVGR